MTEDQPVDNRPAWLIKVQAAGTQPEDIEIDGTIYRYTIVKSGLAPGLPYAVGYPMDTALMISEDVPPENRPYVLFHEVREKKRFSNLPQEDRCKASLQLELEDLQREHPERYFDYIRERRSFFDALKELYDQPDQAQAVSPQFIEGIQASRDYLHAISSGQ